MPNPISTEKPLPVILVPHSKHWAHLAEAEIARLTDLSAGAFSAIHHIGSTSIPGIVAKPIVDLLAEAFSLEVLDAAEPRFTDAGYLWLGEFGIAGRRYLRRDAPVSGERLVHLHAFAAGSDEIARHLAFRDYLRAHPDVASAYEAEKRRAAALHPLDSWAYTDEKEAWIKATERRALKWWRAR